MKNGYCAPMRSMAWLLILALILQGCSFMAHSGPSKSKVESKATDNPEISGVQLIKVNNEIARRLGEQKKPESLASAFSATGKGAYAIGPGDSISVSIWETAPAILFRTGALSEVGSQAGAGTSLPPQMVMDDGSITIPFAGRVKVAGRTLPRIQEEIAGRLSGLANNPQVLVNITSSVNSQVSVIGDVKNNCNIPLTPRGEKLLDALATAGGVGQPLNKVLIQLSRGGKNAKMPLDKIIEDPRQNLQLLPGDVVSAFFQPWSFSVLGATGRNEEVPFEASGISLAQAMARAGGLNDNRADPGGVFIFRFEDPGVLDVSPEMIPADGKVPVVYQIDFDDPGSLFSTQNFPMQDKDVLYVANMPATELTKFLAMVGMVLTPSLSIGRYQMDTAR